MNVEGIKGSIDLSTENVFSQLDKLEGRLNKFAASRGNDGEIIANEMKTIINVMAGAQIEFADQLKNAFDQIEKQHMAYGRKARRIEKDVTKALVEEVMKREQSLATSYAKTSQRFMESQIAYQESLKALTDSKISDRAERKQEREAQKQRAELARQQRELEEKANDTYVRSMARLKKIEQERTEQANVMMIKARQQLKAVEERKKEELSAIKAAEKAEATAIAERQKMVRSFASFVGKTMKGIVWFPVVANQTFQMFQAVGYTIKAMWDNTYGQLIKVNAELEGYEVRLKSITGSHVLAREVFRDVLDYAVKTTYTIKETAQGATSLLPVLKGNREELKKILPLVGDIAATFGLSFEEATGNIIKAISGGIAAADLFRERGISAALGFVPGKTVTGKDTLEKLYKEYEKTSSLFRGAAKELFYTWDGTISKIQDKWMLFLKDIGDAGIFKNLKIALNFVSDRFEQLQDSGGKYQALIKAISDKMTEFLQKLISVINVIVGFVFKSLPKSLQKDLRQALMSADEIQEEYLRDRKKALETSLSGWGWRIRYYSPEEVNRMQTELAETSAELETLSEKTKNAKDNLQDLFNLLNINSAIDSSEIVSNKYNTEFTSRAAFVTGAADARQRALRTIADAAAEEENHKQALLEASQEALEKVQDNLRKAKLNSIKYNQGEWAAFVEETVIEGEKLGQKVSDSMKKNFQDGASLAGNVTSQYISSELQGKIDEYKYEFLGIKKEAETSLTKLSMNEFDSAKLDLNLKYDTEHFKNLPPVLQEYQKAAYNTELKLIELKEAQRKFNQEIDHQSVLTKAAIPAWDTYGQALNDINVEYEKSIYLADKNKKAEAEKVKGMKERELEATTLSDVRTQMEDIQFAISMFGKTELEKKVAEIDRALRVFKQSPDQDIRQVGEELEQLMLKLDQKERLTNFSDGWEDAMAKIKDSMMTDGQAISTFLTDIFSELSSTLSDVFFDVLTGELDSAAEAFDNFAKAILKSMTDIMANQIASQIMGGGMGILSSFFHSGGIVGQGGNAYKKVNPLVFAGAPRFHSGNLGLAHDEYPAILQKGELIIPKGWEKNSVGGGNVAVNIHNESGQDLKVSKATANQDMSGWVISVVVDAVQRDRGGLRTMLRGA